jgi:hypothetical protein
VRALDQAAADETSSAPLRDHSAATLGLLESAARIQRAVLRRVMEEADRRLGRSPLFVNRSAGHVGGERDETPAADGS